MKDVFLDTVGLIVTWDVRDQWQPPRILSTIN